MNDEAAFPGGLQQPNGTGLRAAFALLQHALDCARDAKAPPWDFALEIGELYAAGLSITDLRWMVVKGLVEHGDETSVHGEEHRTFTPSRGLTFLPTTCVMLTAKGAALAARSNASSPGENPGTNGPSKAETRIKPRWDAGRRVLSLGNRLIKRFHVPAPHQERILSACEEGGWPESIDDPLAGAFDIDPKTRLNNVVYRLNNKQLAALVRFHVNGQGPFHFLVDTGATAVAFGGLPTTSFAVVSDTEIDATSPADTSGTVDVQVVGPAGTSPTSTADRFTYDNGLP